MAVPRSRLVPPTAAATLLASLLATVSAHAETAAPKGYTPVPVEIGRAIEPPSDLVAFAEGLRAAALAEDLVAVASVVADDVTMVQGSEDLARGRTMVKTALASTDPAEVVRAIGIAASGGRPLASGGEASTFVAAGLAHVAKALDHPVWGRDPQVIGGYCTYRGSRWDTAALAVAAGPETPALGGMVAEPTPVRAEPMVRARTVETLRPGRLHLAFAVEAPVDGWQAVRLSKGGHGWVPAGTLLPPPGTGVCFLPDVDGGWLMSAVSGART